MKNNFYQFQKEFAIDIIKAMPEEKKQILRNAMDRNCILTSYYGLSWQEIHVYKEGWYLVFKGCRAEFKVWCFDNDGEFVFGRKPIESKLHKLYNHYFCGLYQIELDELV